MKARSRQKIELEVVHKVDESPKPAREWEMSFIRAMKTQNRKTSRRKAIHEFDAHPVQ
ncbi:hypothetical protein [Scopulibacillus darangshiensis]|uniref:hypothetical protein n=1 Tax=Scopulibacillus darangshiensis TaxID=442528 RepID=UPI0014049165|nr:hypothetical protein [Scopulibacillus darangshiensis]